MKRSNLVINYHLTAYNLIFILNICESFTLNPYLNKLLYCHHEEVKLPCQVPKNTNKSIYNSNLLFCVHLTVPETDRWTKMDWMFILLNYSSVCSFFAVLIVNPFSCDLHWNIGKYLGTFYPRTMWCIISKGKLWKANMKTHPCSKR